MFYTMKFIVLIFLSYILLLSLQALYSADSLATNKGVTLFVDFFLANYKLFTNSATFMKTDEEVQM